MTTTEYRRGIRIASAVASIVAAATATSIHAMPATRTGIIRKIHITNRNAANSFVTFGTGLGGAFAASMPPILTIAGQELNLTERELPNVEFTAAITAQGSAAAAAPNDVQVQIEVEEFMGATA